MARPSPNTEVTVPGTDTPLSLNSLKATIVMELAAGLHDAKGIRDKYGISLAQWEVMKRTPLFRDMLKEAIQRLGGDTNAGARIKLKADVLLEDNLKVLDEIANDRDALSQARIEAVKTMANLAGRNQKDTTQGSGTGAFALNIVIGDRELRIEGEKPALEQPDEQP